MITPTANYNGALETSSALLVSIQCYDDVGKALEYMLEETNNIFNQHGSADDYGYLSWDWTCSLKDWAVIVERFNTEPLMKEIDEILNHRFPFLYQRYWTATMTVEAAA